MDHAQARPPRRPRQRRQRRPALENRVIAAQEEVGARPERFTVVGGGTRSRLWLRLLATALDRPVGLIDGADMAGPRGAARLAAVAAGAPVSLLSEPIATTSVIAPDALLANAIAPRRNAMRAMLVG